MTNNFSLLRLFAASLVIFSHAFGFCGMRDPVYNFTGSLTGGILAVYIFFTISGYLISDSWFNRPEIIPYFKKRILRIFPALILVVTLSVFVFGPLMTDLSLKEYFSDTSTYTYFTNLTLWKLQFELPGVHVDGHYVAFNAPLWTLFFEFAMYITIPLFALVKFFEKRRIVFIWILFTAFLCIDFYRLPTDTVFLKINAFYFTKFYLFFYAGVLYRYYRKNKKMNFIFFIVSLTGFILSRDTYLFGLFSLMTVMTFVFNVAFAERRPLRFLVEGKDYSYGMYLYGYIIQVMIQNKIHCSMPLLFKIPLSLLFTFVFAWLSWHLVESKAMKMKNKI